MRLFSFKGRLSRLGYAQTVICTYLAVYPMGVLMSVGAHNIDATFPMTHIPSALVDVKMPMVPAVASFVVGMVGLLAALVVFVAIDVRRFHDCNISGWFVLIWAAIQALLPDRELGAAIPSLSGLIWIAVMITIPGTAGPNRYGPDPRADVSVPG